jgi:hypothetical protein
MATRQPIDFIMGLYLKSQHLSNFCRLLPKSLFAWSKTFFDKSKAALRAQTVQIADLPLRQDLLAKKRFNDRSKEFLFGQQPVWVRFL